MDGGGPVAHVQTGKTSMREFQGSPIFFFVLYICVLYLGVSGPVGLILISE